MALADRIFWLEVVRAVAIAGVVFLHAASPGLYLVDSLPRADWRFANVVDGLARPAVPLFFMASGALLLRREFTFADLGRRVPRLVVPLFCWSLIYLVWRYLTEPDLSVVPALAKMLISPVMYHLWFLYALIGLYLCMPLLSLALRAAGPRHVAYYLALWGVATVLIPTWQQVANVRSSYDLSLVSGALGYFVIGHLVARSATTHGRWVAAGWLAVTMGAAVTILGTQVVSEAQGAFFGFFYNYRSPSVVLYSVGLFYLLKAGFEDREPGPGLPATVISLLARLSFGIYLAHILVRDIGNVLGISHVGWVILPYGAGLLAVTACLAWGLRRIGLGPLLAP